VSEARGARDVQAKLRDEAKMTPERRVNENPKGNDVSRLDAVRSQRGHTSVTRERVNQRGTEGPA